MSWEDLKGQTVNKKDKHYEEMAALAKNYATCFETESGKRVLDHLVKTFIMSNDTPLNSPNVTYEAGYHAGEAGIVKMILNQLQRAKTL